MPPKKKIDLKHKQSQLNDRIENFKEINKELLVFIKGAKKKEPGVKEVKSAITLYSKLSSRAKDIEKITKEMNEMETRDMKDDGITKERTSMYKNVINKKIKKALKSTDEALRGVLNEKSIKHTGKALFDKKYTVEEEEKILMGEESDSPQEGEMDTETPDDNHKGSNKRSGEVRILPVPEHLQSIVADDEREESSDDDEDENEKETPQNEDKDLDTQPKKRFMFDTEYKSGEDLTEKVLGGSNRLGQIFNNTDYSNVEKGMIPLNSDQMDNRIIQGNIGGRNVKIMLDE